MLCKLAASSATSHRRWRSKLVSTHQLRYRAVLGLVLSDSSSHLVSTSPQSPPYLLVLAIANLPHQIRRSQACACHNERVRRSVAFGRLPELFRLLGEGLEKLGQIVQRPVFLKLGRVRDRVGLRRPLMSATLSAWPPSEHLVADPSPEM